MRDDIAMAMLMGTHVKDNTFQSNRGEYEINIVSHNGKMFFYKYRNGTLVEAINLSEIADNREKMLAKRGDKTDG